MARFLTVENGSPWVPLPTSKKFSESAFFLCVSARSYSRGKGYRGKELGNLLTDVEPAGRINKYAEFVSEEPDDMH